ncbi:MULTISPECIES: hypothetical protein [Bacillus]|uniref:Uncharacterized protein n=1 Tax=Bacillus cereus TaxID=1396 RepID=A0A2A8IZ24_BACCE|nr:MULTISPECIES: hypothetical protein [Bacillus]PER24550.1 hypothetical protein CN476_15915 [Bacillus cereus]PFA64891.1 hypothetical protein CN402_02670 [Bacillus sp. AFS015896]PGL84486.1 hypothetical protein CN931_11540 [Bacillus sp. AFS054943]PGU05758.1 hypothetical protein COD19_05965 [Bacillus cereus]PGX09671.1 hypothetical protein COE07_17060 [Bacillus sp. AFS033286]
MTNNKSNDSKEELAIPKIPDTDELINIEDAREGVQVIIPAYENMREGDGIQIYWGDEWNIEEGEKKEREKKNQE